MRSHLTEKDGFVLKRLILGVLGLLFSVLAILILTIVLLRPEDGPPVTIDFTRYLADYDTATEALPESFIAMPGDGRLLVSCAEGAGNLSVRLNGQEVLSPEVSVDCATGLEVPVTLAADNTIAVTAGEVMGGAGSIRIKQNSEVQNIIEGKLARALQELTEEMKRLFEA